MPGPLGHIRVLDFTQVMSGPTTTRYLTELGADVIKVEPPAGDLTRNADLVRDGRSGYFIAQNRGKRSVVINLKDARGVELALALAEGVDVVVENFTPGTMDRLGLGWQHLSPRNPRLVMCSISGFGSEGPMASRPGYDGVAQAYSGFTSLTGNADGPPLMIGAPVGDVLTGVSAAVGILAALVETSASGRGCHVETSLLETYLQTHDYGLQTHSISQGAEMHRRNGRFSPSAVPYGVFTAPDGHIFIAAAADPHWRDLCDAMERPELYEPGHPWSDRAGRTSAASEVHHEIERWLSTLGSRDAATDRLVEFRVPAGPVLAMDEVASHPAMREAGMIRTASDPVLDGVDVAGFPLRFDGERAGYDTEAPLLGEHTVEVVAPLVGSDLDELLADGVIHQDGSELRSRQRD